MTIELNVYTQEPTATERRIFEMLTENTGIHMADSGGDSGRNWQRNQALTCQDFMKLPDASLSTEWGNQITLDTFHYLNERLTLTPLAESLQADWEHFINSDDERSFYSCVDMEQFCKSVDESGDEVRIANSYNWDNYLSQVVQYVNFYVESRSFTLLQIHGGADVRGGYTSPQVFETCSELWAHSMSDAIIQCTGEDCTCAEGSEPCDWTLDIYGCTDFIGSDGSIAMTSSEFYELKSCPKCGGRLEALAPSAEWY